MRINRKWFVRIVSAALALCVIGTSFVLVDTFVSSAENNVYSESNPELKECIISTNKQSQYYNNTLDYVPYANFQQGEGKYSIDTDAYCIWSSADDCAYMYREYEIGNKATDKLTITVDLTKFVGTMGGKYSTASAGLMIRDDLSPDSPEIFFHVRENGIYNIWRTNRGGDSANTTNSIPNDWPTGLKIEKVGNKYTTYYKLNGSNVWAKESIKYLNFTGTIYVGLTTHCSDRNQPVLAEFANLTIEGEGTPDEPPAEEGGDGNTSSDPIVGEGIPWEDAPYDEETTLLYETFTDGSMTKGEESVSNPIWDTEYANLVLTEDGDRKWYRDHITSWDYIGDESWTDYTASVDVAFDDVDESIQRDGQFIFYVRHKVVYTLGHTDYGVCLFSKTISGETKQYIALVKRFRNSSSKTYKYFIAEQEIDNFFGNGDHNIKVKAFDNNIVVWYDGEEVFNHYDNGATSYEDLNGAFPASFGNLGFYSKDLGVYIDNIIVTKLDDPHGGDYDNQICDNWDEDIPEYVTNYGK